jgi:hypothetical protein
MVYTGLDTVDVASYDLKKAIVDDEGSTVAETPR